MLTTLMNLSLQNFVPADRPKASPVTIRGVFLQGDLQHSSEAYELRDDFLIVQSLHTEDCAFGMQQDSWPRAIRARQMQSKAANFATYL
jgi:hypothetical protein